MRLDGDREIEKTRALLAEHGLLPDIPVRYDHDKDAADLLRRRILATAQPERLPSRRRRPALLIVAALLVAVLAAGAGVLLYQRPVAAATAPVMLTYSVAGPDSPDSAPPADNALTAAARLAAASPQPGTQPDAQGSVQYLARYGWLAGADAAEPDTVTVVLYPTLTQWWLMSDGAVRVDESREAPLDLHGRLTIEPEGAPGPRTSDAVPAGSLDAGLAERLSTDPAALRAELLETQVGLPCDEGAHWTASCLVQAVQTLYDQYVVPPGLASALWEVLAGEPALRSWGTTTDRLGRPAVAVALPPESGETISPQVTVLLISSSTGAYLGTETIMLRDPAQRDSEPTVLGFSELSTAYWVGAPGNTR